MTAATPDAFADHAAIAAGWRPLSDDEKVRATTLLGMAGRWIRSKRAEIGRPIVDDDADARYVSVEVVRAALLREAAARAAEKYAGFSSVSRTAGSRSFAGTVDTNATAAAGDPLQWPEWATALLGLRPGGKPRVGSRASFGDGGYRERF